MFVEVRVLCRKSKRNNKKRNHAIDNTEYLHKYQYIYAGFDIISAII